MAHTYYSGHKHLSLTKSGDTNLMNCIVQIAQGRKSNLCTYVAIDIMFHDSQCRDYIYGIQDVIKFAGP